MNMEWEIGLIKGELRNLNEKIEKKAETLYGNGQEGLTSRVKGLEDDMDKVTLWKEGWEKVTNYDEFKKMRSDIARLIKQSYLLTAIIIVAVFLINLFGPKITDVVMPNKQTTLRETDKTEVRYIYRQVPVHSRPRPEPTIEQSQPANQVMEEPMDFYLSNPDAPAESKP